MEERNVAKKQFKQFKTGASKDIQGKLRLDLVPPEMIEALARVLTYGATKYADNNWRQGIPYMTSVGSSQRHLMDFLKGIDIDTESGLYNIEQAFLNLGMIVTQHALGRKDLDDRYREKQVTKTNKSTSSKEYIYKTFDESLKESECIVKDGIYYHRSKS